MSPRLLSVAALLLFAAVPAQAHGLSGIFGNPGTMGSGKLETQQREVSGFDSIALEDSSDLVVTVGQPFSVSVTADDNILSHIDTETHGSQLVISSHGSYTSRHDVRVEVHLPTLRRLELSGSGDVRMTGVDSPSLTLSISGSGDIQASGRADDLDANIEGSGDLSLDQLEASRVRVQIDGSGDARVYARQSLKAEINGSGDIQYRGEPPQLRQEVNGSGSVSRL